MMKRRHFILFYISLALLVTGCRVPLGKDACPRQIYAHYMGCYPTGSGATAHHRGRVNLLRHDAPDRLDSLYLTICLDPNCYKPTEPDGLLSAKVGNRETAEAMSRRHLVTHTDARAEGIALDNILPLKLSSGQFSRIRINLGGGTQGRQTTIILGLSSAENIKSDDLTVRFNTGLCSAQDYAPELELPENKWKIQAFSVSPESLHDGNNMIEIIKKSDSAINIDWCEVYLEK